MTNRARVVFTLMLLTTAWACLILVLGCASTGGAPLPSPVQEPTSLMPPAPVSPTTNHPPEPTRSPSVSPDPGPVIPGVLTPIADEGRVTQSVTLRPGQCHARDSGRLPDRACTPGSVDPAVTQATIHATICVRGWTATIRPPSGETMALKFDVTYPAYSLPASATSELDHLVPLELGGSNDVTNLWPETGPVPNAKDPVENDLRADVCAGELQLAAAQLAVAGDWETVP